MKAGARWLLCFATAVAMTSQAALPPKPSDLPWSFRQLQRPAVPKTQNTTWPKDDRSAVADDWLPWNAVGGSSEATVQ